MSGPTGLCWRWRAETEKAAHLGAAFGGVWMIGRWSAGSRLDSRSALPAEEADVVAASITDGMRDLAAIDTDIREHVVRHGEQFATGAAHGGPPIGVAQRPIDAKGHE